VHPETRKPQRCPPWFFFWGILRSREGVHVSVTWVAFARKLRLLRELVELNKPDSPLDGTYSLVREVAEMAELLGCPPPLTYKKIHEKDGQLFFFLKVEMNSPTGDMWRVHRFEYRFGKQHFIEGHKKILAMLTRWELWANYQIEQTSPETCLPVTSEPPTKTAPADTTPSGFLGGEQLAKCLRIPRERQQAFLKALARLRKPETGKRAQLPDTDWQEVHNIRQSTPRFLYRVDALAVQQLAERYTKTVGQKRPTTVRREKIMQRKVLPEQHFSVGQMSDE